MKPDDLATLRTHSLPRVLWIELTSRCPFKCIFCTRASLRGNGEHMNFETYRLLIETLIRPRIIRLNYAGESGHYPRLADAIRLAAATGAEVELVSALASLNPTRLQAALESGLNRLTVSLHTLHDNRFNEIYGFSSIAAMHERLQQALSWRNKSRSRRFALDLAFVAMNSNLDELPAIAAFAQANNIEVLAVHPLIERSPLPMGPSAEHAADGSLEYGFAGNLRTAIETAQAIAPSVQLQISSNELHHPPTSVGSEAIAWPWPLPKEVKLAGCSQDPFETVHILADGSVVPCEVTERESMGNLHQQSLHSIWHGERYRNFRKAHLQGDHHACNACIYKTAHRPQAPTTSLAGASASESQLIRGWHPLDDSNTRWSTAEAALLLNRPSQARHFHLSGVLAAQNEKDGFFELYLDGKLAYRQSATPGCQIDLHLELPAGEDTLYAELKCTKASSPAALALGRDSRELGFALFEARCS